MPSRGIAKILNASEEKTQAELRAEVNRLQQRLQREKHARAQAEDMLEQKAADLYEKNQDLTNLSGELEKLVAQRTAQMQNARDDALTALKIKSDFIANMSHELRTPMNGVLGILALLSDEKLSEKQRELVDIAQASGQHLLLVINDVLDFSKIEAEKIDLVMAPVNIRNYISKLCKPFELQAQQKNIDFNFKISEKLPQQLITDKLRLTQIITNLLSNALKFTQEGGVSLHINILRHSPDQKHTYRLSVCDTGIGISQENIDAVFSAFEQADTSITREFGGTGLGMSITKKLVDMFEGKISLESELGKGTTFHVDFSFHTCSQDNEIEQDEVHKVFLPNQARLLLVEDNKINQLVAMKMLDAWGIDAELAEDGQQAIDILKKQSFDMVLMDLQMPVKGGIEASQEIRQEGIIDKDTPIIAMTAHSTQEHIQECFDAGMQGHISKPIDKDLLHSTIGKYIQDLNKQESAISDEIENELPNVPGINLKEGLKRLNGDKTLLFTLVNNFVQEYATLKDSMIKHQDSDDFEAAISLLHRIKGSGGNLGMQELAALASEGEKQLRTSSPLNQHQIQEFQNNIELIKTHLHKFENIIEPREVESMREESSEYLLSAMDIILDNLSKDILASEDGLKDLSRCLLKTNTQKHINIAIHAMQKFDIEGVSSAIQHAKLTLD